MLIIELIFLDISILKEPNGRLANKLFRKVTTGNSLLHADSFHPEHNDVSIFEMYIVYNFTIYPTLKVMKPFIAEEIIYT